MAYVGQAAHISKNPDTYSNPFFKAVPPGAFYPALVVSILASIVASQALITSTFQLLFQVINMSYFPPIKIVNTSLEHHSQIYIPVANWLMMIGTIVVTVVFKDTTKLGNAYGVCVILDTVITTTLVSLVALIVWRIKWYFVLPLTLTFATFEGLYLTSALRKVPDGAWFTITLAVCLAIVFCTWRFGKERQWHTERKTGLARLSKLVKKSDHDQIRLVDAFGGGEVTEIKGKIMFAAQYDFMLTIGGLGIFFDKVGGDAVPVIYEEFLHKFEAQPLVQVFLHLRATTVPFIAPEDQYTITKTGFGHCYRMVIRYGYAEQPMTSQLGNTVYEQLKQYIATELSDDGRTSVIQGQIAIPTPTPAPSTEKSADANVDSLNIDEKSPDPLSSPPSPAPQNYERGRRLSRLDTAYSQQVLFIVGKEELILKDTGINFIKRGFLNAFLWVRTTTNQKVSSMRIPTDKLIEVGFIREI
jgi:KUP system potassium uptake protein